MQDPSSCPDAERAFLGRNSVRGCSMCLVKNWGKARRGSRREDRGLAYRRGRQGRARGKKDPVPASPGEARARRDGGRPPGPCSDPGGDGNAPRAPRPRSRSVPRRMPTAGRSPRRRIPGAWRRAGPAALDRRARSPRRKGWHGHGRRRSRHGYGPAAGNAGAGTRSGRPGSGRTWARDSAKMTAIAGTCERKDTPILGKRGAGSWPGMHI